MQKYKKKSHTESQKGAANSIIKHILTGSLTGTAIFFVLMCLLSFLAYKQDFDEKYYTAIVVFSGIFSAFASGFISVIPTKRNGLAIGILSVLPSFTVIITVASILSRTGIGAVGWIILGIMILCGGTGGIAAANKRRRLKIK